jgi:hypothetical protein
MKTLRTKSLLGSTWRRGFLLIPLLACFALSPQARAICQQGCDVTHANTFLGEGALIANTTGTDNTAIGWQALFDNTTGSFNAANGVSALWGNTTGSLNTATGYGALMYNTTGDGNTASGTNALLGNTLGSNNTAIGHNALSKNTTASSNTATGHLALGNNTTGYRNTATGEFALVNNDSGHGNTAIGYQALYQNIGSDNVALGFNAGNQLFAGSGNVYIGHGVLGVASESDTTRIRNVYGSIAFGRAVYVNSDSKIGTLASTRRVKKDIKPIGTFSESVFALKPVSFRYKKEIDASGTLQFGLVAEEVAEIDGDLVTRDAEGKPETVRYDAVNTMLLNEFLKEHRKVEEQETTISQLRSLVGQQQKDFQTTVAQLTARLDHQATQIQEVSAQFESRKPALQVVNIP